ncbi:unnamed protein product, partial [Ilex paraguariensis]
GTIQFQVNQKLKLLKVEFKKVNKEKVGDVMIKALEAKEQLSACQRRLVINSLTNHSGFLKKNWWVNALRPSRKRSHEPYRTSAIWNSLQITITREQSQILSNEVIGDEIKA